MTHSDDSDKNTPRPEKRNPTLGPTAGVTGTYELLLHAQSGDRTALDRVCRRYLPRLQRWATHRLPEGARGIVETEDIVQDILINSIQRLENLELADSGAFHGYLRQAVLHRIRNEARKIRNRGPEVEDPEWLPDPSPSPAERMIGRDVLSRFETAMTRLDPSDQEAILARIDLGFTYEEAAEALGKPSAEAARKTISRALVKLAREMALE